MLLLLMNMRVIRQMSTNSRLEMNFKSKSTIRGLSSSRVKVLLHRN
jgi:hypothetical protein